MKSVKVVRTSSRLVRSLSVCVTSVASETTDRYRWPVIQTRQPYLPMRDKILVDGPLQSPPAKPRLRYHRQSSYTDVFGRPKLSTTPKLSVTHIPATELNWKDPVGKCGDFYGASTHEKDFDWPDTSYNIHKLPLVSTIGMGILPLLGTKGDTKDITTTEEKSKASEDKSKIKLKMKQKDRQLRVQKNLHIQSSVPLPDIWPRNTTYRQDFLIPPKGWRSDHVKAPEQELKISGDMQTETTTMLDFQAPRPTQSEEDFWQNTSEKLDTNPRWPLFLF